METAVLPATPTKQKRPCVSVLTFGESLIIKRTIVVIDMRNKFCKILWL